MPLVQNEPKKIYIWVDATPITTPGIYHNSDLGLISLSSDGTNWTTIADKNIGATSTDVSSADSYGYFYQRGNCYGFPTSGSVVVYGATVDASAYGPGNYYSEEHWRRQDPRDYSNNNNLRGGTTGTNEAMKGPCNTGFHIPTNTELSNLITLWTTITGHTTSDISSFASELLIPRAGERKTDDGSRANAGSYLWLWASKAYNNSNGYVLVKDSSTIRVTYMTKSYGCNIRPFKNEAVQPDDSWDTLYVVTLLSFAEIQAMSYSAALTELNTNPTTYYNKFNGEGDLVDLGTYDSSLSGLVGYQTASAGGVYGDYNVYNTTSSTKEGIATSTRGVYSYL